MFIFHNGKEFLDYVEKAVSCCRKELYMELG